MLFGLDTLAIGPIPCSPALLIGDRDPPDRKSASRSHAQALFTTTLLQISTVGDGFTDGRRNRESRQKWAMEMKKDGKCRR